MHGHVLWLAMSAGEVVFASASAMAGTGTGTMSQ
jgi:hypothetical protein